VAIAQAARRTQRVGEVLVDGEQGPLLRTMDASLVRLDITALSAVPGKLRACAPLAHTALLTAPVQQTVLLVGSTPYRARVAPPQQAALYALLDIIARRVAQILTTSARLVIIAQPVHQLTILHQLRPARLVRTEVLLEER
jgi:hypothetical protein